MKTLILENGGIFKMPTISVILHAEFYKFWKVGRHHLIIKYISNKQSHQMSYISILNSVYSFVLVIIFFKACLHFLKDRIQNKRDMITCYLFRLKTK